MIDKDILEKVSRLKPGVVRAIDAMFELNAAIGEHDLSCNDLAEGLALAIDGPRQGNDGHDMAIISMVIMAQALELDRSGQSVRSG